MTNVLEATGYQLLDVVVVEAVEHVTPLFPTFNEAHLSKVPEVMRGGRLAELSVFRQLAHVVLTIRQGSQNQDTRAIS